MKDNKKEIILKFDLPEFERPDIDIKLGKNSALIKAKKTIEKKAEKPNFFHHEKTQKSFVYQTTLPDINHKKARVEFKKSVLKITAPKG